MTYDTHDLGLAAALSLNFQIDHVDDSNPRRLVFCFDDTPDVKKMVSDYFDGKLMVIALDYQAKLKQLKARTYQAKGYLYR